MLLYYNNDNTNEVREMNIEFSRRMQSVKASAIREILKATSNPDIISFAGGNPAAEAFPVDAIKEISQELFEEDPIGLLQYGITEGDKGFLEAASRFFNRNEQVTKPGDKIIVATGSQQIMDFAGKCLCNEGDYVVCEEPSFLGALNAFKASGALLRGVPFKDQQIDLEKLEEALSAQPTPKFMYLIPNYQNPMGTTMSLETRKKVLALAKKYGVLILEDNPYGDLRFAGDAIPSIKSLDDEGYIIYAASLSKIIAPGMRVACAIANEQIIEKFVVAKQSSDVHTNLWAQKVMARYLDDFDMDIHLERLQAIYRQKCELMLSEMDKHFAKSVTYTRPQGGMFIWVTLPDHVDVNAFVKEALSKNVAIVPGAAFMTDDTKECHAFRMNFSTPTNQKIVDGVKILGDMTQAL